MWACVAVASAVLMTGAAHEISSVTGRADPASVAHASGDGMTARPHLVRSMLSHAGGGLKRARAERRREAAESSCLLVVGNRPLRTVRYRARTHGEDCLVEERTPRLDPATSQDLVASRRRTPSTATMASLRRQARSGRSEVACLAAQRDSIHAAPPLRGPPSTPGSRPV